MVIFKRKYVLRRYGGTRYVDGYPTAGYEDMLKTMDIQTTADQITTKEDGSQAVQTIKAFCDEEFKIDNPEKKQRADQVYFQGKWFNCTSSKLSDNTLLRHYVATFTESEEPAADPEVTP